MKYVNLHHSMPEVNSAEYQAFHRAVRRKWGNADNYHCFDCKNRRACDWAWIHKSDPSDPNNYRPMCRPCHQEYDSPEWLKEERAKKRLDGARKGWTPERRARASDMARQQWNDGTLNRTEQSVRAKRDKPWTGRRPKNGGGAR